jgi:hypothetical protein
MRIRHRDNDWLVRTDVSRPLADLFRRAHIALRSLLLLLLLISTGLQISGKARSRTWVERPPKLGVPFSTIWAIAAYVVLLPHRSASANTLSNAKMPPRLARHPAPSYAASPAPWC